MSLQSDLAQADAEFRRRQTALQAGVGLLVKRRFAALPVEDIMANGIAPSVESWLRVSTAITEALNARSAREGRDFYDSVRDLLQPGAGPAVHAERESTEIEAIRTSLIVTGLVRARKGLARPAYADPTAPGAGVLDQGTRLEVLDKAGEGAGAEAGRHVVNGGRDQIIATQAADPRAVGYVRVTSSKPCYFCAMLASRGGVYDDDSFDESDARFIGPGRAKVHSHCSCSLRPLFTRSNSEIPELSRSFDQRWQALRREHGTVTLTLWRQAYEGRLKTD